MRKRGQYEQHIHKRTDDRIPAEHDGQGNTVSLTDEDMDHIMSCIGMAYTQAKPDGYKVLLNCEYFQKGE